MSFDEAQRRIAACKQSQSDRLDLCNLNLAEIPKDLSELHWLTMLDLSLNQISRIEGLEALSNLKILFLYKNQIKQTGDLNNLKSLQILLLGSNQISQIEGLGALRKLKIVDLNKNLIIRIEGLHKLSGLQKLCLSFNQISRIEGLDALSSLQELYLDNNQISRLEGLDALSGLQMLDLDNNQISSIESLETLSSLQTLNLSNNQISRIEGLDTLTTLKKLDVQNNQLAQIEDLIKLSKISHLEIIRINHNPIFQQYGVVLDDHWEVNHLEQVKKLVEESDSYQEMSLPRRVMLLGNHAAGKSSLMHYIEEQKLSCSSQSTHGLNVKPLYIQEQNQDGQLPDAIFFDFGGQDYYHGIYRVFLRQHSSQIVVVNPQQNINKICDENTATVENPQYTQDFSLDYWAAQLRYFQVSTAEANIQQDTFLVQSHADLEPQQQWHYARCLQDRLIRFDLLMLKEQPEPFDKLALEHFRQSLVQHIQSNQNTILQTERRAKQIQYILNFWDNGQEKFHPLDVAVINEEINGDDYPLYLFKMDLEQLSRAGLIWYDQKIAQGKMVWLHPKGLVDHLYTKLLAPELLRNTKKQGVLGQQDLDSLRLHPATLELLQFYQIIFKHQPHQDDANTIEYIIPNYLPLSNQDKALHNISTFGLEQPTFRLRFAHFMPMGLINQAICFFGLQPDDKLFWRDLMVFTLSKQLKGRYRVMLRLDFSQLEISVCIQPEQSSYVAAEYQQVKHYLFYCLMRFYWDLYANDGKPAEFEHFVSIVISGKPEHGRSKQAEVVQAKFGWGDSSEQYRFDRPLWRKFYGNLAKHDQNADSLKFVPNDLYVSLGTDTWVKYRDLVTHPTDETYIQRYALESKPEQPTQFASKGQTQAKPFEIFLNRELRAVKKIFISYSRKDVEYKDELSLFLKTTLCSHGHEVWDCGMLEEGKWDEQIQNKLLEADLVILMLSINFFSSNYIVQDELIKTLERIDQGQSPQKMMCIVVKTFPWASFAQLAKHSKISSENLAQYQRSYLQEDVVQYQFLPYRKQSTSSINTENRELLVPLAKIHPNERDDVYTEIVQRVMKALQIAQ